MKGICLTFFLVVATISSSFAHWGGQGYGQGFGGYYGQGYRRSYGHHHQHDGNCNHGGHGNHHHRGFGGGDHINFEIFEPQGIKIWKPVHAGITMFGIEAAVNADLSRTEIECDICVNTTLAVDGKFVIEDDSIVLKAGDVLSYISLYELRRSVKKFPLITLTITESMIKPSNKYTTTPTPRTTTTVKFQTTTNPTTTNPTTTNPTTTNPTATNPTTTNPTTTTQTEKTTTPWTTSTAPTIGEQGTDRPSEDYENELEYECVIDPQTNLCINTNSGIEQETVPVKYTTSKSRSEIALLENIIFSLVANCSTTTPNNDLVLDPSGIVPEGDILDFVKNLLTEQGLPKELVRSVVSAQPIANKNFVMFTVETLIYKVKILYFTQFWGDLNVMNYDPAKAEGDFPDFDVRFMQIV